MSMVDRAVLFYPFAAFTGHDGIIAEAARLTDERPILDESVKLEISNLLQEAVSPAALAHESTSSPAYLLKNVKKALEKRQKNVKIICNHLKTTHIQRNTATRDRNEQIGEHKA